MAALHAPYLEFVPNSRLAHWRDAAGNIICTFDSANRKLLIPSGAKIELAGKVAYVAGAGGAVTQTGSASTGVTLHKICGQITTVALTTAAAAEERFTVTNNQVAATDVVALSTTYNGNGTVGLSVQKVAAGAFDIVITNLHASAAFNAAMVINFVVIPAVAA
jgi:hypothetical protein